MQAHETALEMLAEVRKMLHRTERQMVTNKEYITNLVVSKTHAELDPTVTSTCFVSWCNYIFPSLTYLLWAHPLASIFLYDVFGSHIFGSRCWQELCVVHSPHRKPKLFSYLARMLVIVRRDILYTLLPVYHRSLSS